MRVLSAATAVQPNTARALFMVKNEPIPAFRHKTLLQLVQEGRTDDAIDYLESIVRVHRMILHDLPPGTTLFRARIPGSGPAGPPAAPVRRPRAGASTGEGIEALYLSLEELTALREYQQTSPSCRPARCALTP